MVPVMGVTALSEREQAEQDGHGSDGKVDVEAPWPRSMLDEQACNHGTGCHRDCRSATPHCDREVEPLLGERAADDCERVRHQHRTEDAKHRSEADNAADRADKTDAERAEGEAGRPYEHEQPTAITVADLAHRDEQDCQGQQVGVGYPLQI